jgi:hypothetical protein
MGDGSGPAWAGGRWNCRRFGRVFGFGRGFGQGFGSGRWQNAYPQQPSAAEEAEYLKSYADDLRSELDSVMKRIEAIKKE